MAYVKFLVILAAFIGYANTLECYVCRGCAEVTADDVQTCDVSPTPAPTEEPVTDQDTVFEVDGIQVIGAAPLLDEDNELNQGFVLDNSELPGAKHILRSLKQFRDEESDARCVIAVYHNGDGSPNVVRGCSTTSEDQETRCREAVGDSYAGTLEYCNLCAEDLCNSAAKSTLAFVLILVGILVNLTYF